MKRRMTKDGVVRQAVQGLPGGVDRRDFLKASALVAGMGVWVATGSRVKGVEEQSANDRINGASIGVGGKGDSDSQHLSNHANLVAICDVDETTLESKAKRHPKAKTFTDFRKMFDEMGKEIDAVTISTPDHTHAVATMQAIKMGKHVYTQKPLAHDVSEVRALRMAAAEHKIASQMGNQGTHNDKLREGVDAIRAGVIGAVKEVHVWTNRPIWPQAPGVMERPSAQPVPETMHWDEWLGTAPERPYNKGYAPFNWRGWWDYGTGALGDMGCHTANLPFMALKLEYPNLASGRVRRPESRNLPLLGNRRLRIPRPRRIAARHPQLVRRTQGREEGSSARRTGRSQKVMAEFNKKHGKKDRLIDSGSLIIGEKGMIYTPDDYGGNWDLLPADNFADYKDVPVLPRNDGDNDEGNKIEWLQSARDGKPSVGNFSYAGLLAETILLGNIAIKNMGKKLEWDGPKMTFPDMPEANKLLRRTYRAPWSL